MICEHCGNQNPDNTRICTHCGMPVGKSDGQNTVKKEEPEVKTSKNVMKKKSWLLIIGIPVAAYLIGQVAGGKTGESMNEDSDSASSIVEDVNTPIEEGENNTEAENPEYTKIFTERNIIRAPYFTIEEGAYFAKVDVDEEGRETIDCLDFSYNGDTGTISALTETVYIDIKDLSQEEVQAMDSAVQAESQEYANLDNFTMSCEAGNQYYRITYMYDKLNDKDVLKTFEELELITATDPGEELLGISPTETSLLEQGYVKK